MAHLRGRVISSPHRMRVHLYYLDNTFWVAPCGCPCTGLIIHLRTSRGLTLTRRYCGSHRILCNGVSMQVLRCWCSSSVSALNQQHGIHSVVECPSVLPILVLCVSGTARYRCFTRVNMKDSYEAIKCSCHPIDRLYILLNSPSVKPSI